MTVEAQALLGILAVALRGAVAIGLLLVFAGGLPRIVQLGLAITFGLWSALVVTVPVPATVVELVTIAAREAVVGATLGIVAVMPLVAAATAGRLVDRAAMDRAPHAALFSLLAAAVFVGIDGHVAVLSALVESHREVPSLAAIQPRVLDAVGALVGNAVALAIPWLVTAAIVELAIGVGTRVATGVAFALPGAVAVPAALVMISAALLSTLAIAIAALVRGTL